MNEFSQFRSKAKFVEDLQLMYPGIENESYRKEYSDKVNLIANDFEEVAKAGNGKERYLEKIKIGLARFGDTPDTEDKGRICSYIEELMDIVGLESSDGPLNSYVY